MVRDTREAFVERVKAIDPIFRRGDLKAFWPLLRALMDIGPERPDLSKKFPFYSFMKVIIYNPCRKINEGIERF